MKKSTSIVFWILDMILVILNIITAYTGIISNNPPYRIVLQIVAACLWAKSAGIQFVLMLKNKADD